MVTKKTASKAKVKSKTTGKKTVKRTTKKVLKTNAVVSQVAEPSNNGYALLWFFVSLFFIGSFIGSLYVDLIPSKSASLDGTQKILRLDGQTFVSVKNLGEDFLVELGETKKGKNEFAVYNDKTWIPVNGTPVEMIVLTDSNCTKCDTSNSLQLLRQNVTPALLSREVQVTSEEGIKLVAEFDLQTIPQYILADGVSALIGNDGMKFVETAKNVLIEKNGLYLVDGARVGFTPGEFLAVPEFANLDSEPVLGKGGKVRVVEFTDYQCPYCKRLHDNNKELIAKLVKEGKIEYILKDFPLDFHKESVLAHKAATCVLREGSNELYWEMNAKLFQNGPAWHNKGAQGANKYFISLAKDLDVDIVDCLEDPALDQEIAADIEEGRKYGVSGTPALFIGKSMMPGAIDAKTFEEAVNAALK